MRTLVTGAAGFIGSTLVDRLLLEGHQVTGVDNLSAGPPVANLESAHRHNGPGRFTFVAADVRHPELSDVIAGSNPDVVFHLAAQIDVRSSVDDPQFDARNNVLGTINVLEASRRARVPRIVYASSGGARYGAPATLPATEDTPVDPLSPYAAAKVAGELYMRAYAGMYGLSPICLALANVYGPRRLPRAGLGVAHRRWPVPGRWVLARTCRRRHAYTTLRRPWPPRTAKAGQRACPRWQARWPTHHSGHRPRRRRRSAVLVPADSLPER